MATLLPPVSLISAPPMPVVPAPSEMPALLAHFLGPTHHLLSARLAPQLLFLLWPVTYRAVSTSSPTCGCVEVGGTA